jgi:hypothetical protein
MNYKNLFFVSLLLLLNGCATGPDQPFVSEVQGIRVISHTTDLQSAFMKDRGSIEAICASRQGDVADTKSVGFGMNVSAVGQNDGVEEGSATGAVSLGGRSSTVLITRELMYRACELSMNLNLDKEEAINVYTQFLSAIVQISQSQMVQGDNGLASGAVLPFVAPVKPGETSTNE